MSSPDDLIPVKPDAVSESGLAERTLRRYIHLGLLPAFRVGPRAVRVRRGDVQALRRPITPVKAGDAA